MGPERLARVAGNNWVAFCQQLPEILDKVQLVGNGAAEIPGFEERGLWTPSHDRHTVAGGHDAGSCLSGLVMQINAAGFGISQQPEQLDHLLKPWRGTIRDRDVVSNQQISQARHFDQLDVPVSHFCAQIDGGLIPQDLLPRIDKRGRSYCPAEA